MRVWLRLAQYDDGTRFGRSRTTTRGGRLKDMPGEVAVVLLGTQQKDTVEGVGVAGVVRQGGRRRDMAGPCRLDTFATRPLPVQVSFLPSDIFVQSPSWAIHSLRLFSLGDNRKSIGRLLVTKRASGRSQTGGQLVPSVAHRNWPHLLVLASFSPDFVRAWHGLTLLASPALAMLAASDVSPEPPTSRTRVSRCVPETRQAHRLRMAVVVEDADE